MDIYTQLFTSSKINEVNPKPKLKKEIFLHETSITKLDLPYIPLVSPRKKGVLLPSIKE